MVFLRGFLIAYELGFFFVVHYSLSKKTPLFDGVLLVSVQTNRSSRIKVPKFSFEFGCSKKRSML